jgi:hypothetical protein
MMRLKFLALISASCCLISTARAMDRWSALSMLESGDNDSATGLRGEISRFQIRPQFWPGGNPRNSKAALAVAQKLMNQRVAEFVRTHKRAPTDFEFYVLWNAPAEVNHPRGAVAARAQRFVNLVQRS